MRESDSIMESMTRVEDNVNRRAGHVAVGHKGRALVWGGYMENQVDHDQYWSSGEIWIYNSLTQTWSSRRTTGEIPSKCSGAAATVMDDTMYVVAGFHKIVVSLKSIREGKLGALDQESSDHASDSSDDEDDSSGHMVSSVEISNSIWSLDLNTYIWSKLEPGGVPPLRCDKTACWTYGDKVYLFGGFGPPPASQVDKLGTLFEFVEDPTTTSGYSSYTRGWSNQLVVYNSLTNKWEWPACTGQPPSPRAAHSVSVVGNTAYVFGGRHQDNRLNDLHCLDLVNMKWSLMVADTDASDVPVGRSWQTMTPIHTGKEEGGLVIYGGFDTNQTALGDCWRMDLSLEPSSWVRCRHLELGPRLWHQAVALDSSQVMVVGGLMNNILAPGYVAKHHAEKVLFLRVAPSSLLKLCLEYITKHRELFNKEVEELPLSLKRIVKIRCSSGA